jgi:hypothetical protein
MGTGEQEKRIVDLISSAEGRPERAAGISSRPKDRDTPVQDTMSTGSRIEQAIAGSDAGYLAKHVEELTRWAAGRRDASSEEDEIAETASSGEVAQALGLALNAARLLSENGYEHEARKILDRGLENDSAGEDQLEEIYFALGKLYEKPGPLRDEPTAVGYYRKVVHGFPSGVYWQEAKERIRYLERHYLQLR